MRLKDVEGQASCIRRLGDLAMRTDDLSAADQHFQAALKLFTQIDAKLGQANTLVSQAAVLDARGDLDAVQRNFSTALQVFGGMGDVYSQALTYGTIAEMWLRHARAKDAYRAWARRIALIATLEPVLFIQMLARTLGQSRRHAAESAEEAAAGCVVLLQELEPLHEQATQRSDERAAHFLDAAVDAFRIIAAVAASSDANPEERMRALERARDLAIRFDEATNNVFDMTAWVDEAST